MEIPRGVTRKAKFGEASIMELSAGMLSAGEFASRAVECVSGRLGPL